MPSLTKTKTDHRTRKRDGNLFLEQALECLFAIVSQSQSHLMATVEEFYSVSKRYSVQRSTRKHTHKYKSIKSKLKHKPMSPSLQTVFQSLLGSSYKGNGSRRSCFTVVCAALFVYSLYLRTLNSDIVLEPVLIQSLRWYLTEILELEAKTAFLPFFYTEFVERMPELHRTFVPIPLHVETAYKAVEGFLTFSQTTGFQTLLTYIN